MCGTKRPLPHPPQLAHRWRRRERLPHGRGRRSARDTRADVNGADYDGEAEDDGERPDENSTPAYPPAPEVHITAQHATRANRSQPRPSARLSGGARRTELPTAAGEVGVGSEASARTSGIRSPFRLSARRLGRGGVPINVNLPSQPCMPLPRESCSANTAQLAT